MSVEIWKEVYNLISIRNNNKVWLNAANYKSLDNNVLTLSFTSNLFLNNYKKLLESDTIKCFKELCDIDISINYEINENTSNIAIEEEVKKEPEKKVAVPLTNHSRYTFDNFVASEFNSFPYKIALSIAMNPGVTNNPFLIYGGVGLGKTHLLCAIANYIKEHDKSKKVIYITAETFTNEYIEYIFNKKEAVQFRYKYRKADVLLIDDIHFLQEKSGSQEELFHTFNELYEAGKQIVFTCDRPIQEMKGFTDRLKSRFLRGGATNLKMSDYETRSAILLKKCQNLNVEMPAEILDYIAANVQTNIRDLEACLNTVIQYRKFQNTNLTIDILKEIMSNIIKFDFASKQEYTFEDILKEVAEFFKVTVLDLKSRKKTALVSNARQIAIYLAREVTNCSFTEIGTYFNRDHSTIIHAHKAICEKRIENSELNENIIKLTGIFNK